MSFLHLTHHHNQRTVIVPDLLQSENYTGDITKYISCFLEANGGTICISIPVLKPFFMQCLPGIMM